MSSSLSSCRHNTRRQSIAYLVLILVCCSKQSNNNIFTTTNCSRWVVQALEIHNQQNDNNNDNNHGINGDLVCEVISNGPTIQRHVDDDDDNKDDVTLKCSFQVKLSSRNAHHENKDFKKKSKDISMEVCTMTDDRHQEQQQPPTEYCVSAKIKVQQQQQKQQSHSNSKTMDDTTTTPTTTAATSAADDYIDNESINSSIDVIVVGEASYHPPFIEQYGKNVGTILQNQQSYITERQQIYQQYIDIAMASWYIELGNAHIRDIETKTIQQQQQQQQTLRKGTIPQQQQQEQVNNDLGVWYNAELAINAYQHSLQTLLNDDKAIGKAAETTVVSTSSSSSSSSSNEQAKRELIATTHFQLGEAYSLDPKSKHLDTTLEHYHKAKNGYERLRYEYSTWSINNDDDDDDDDDDDETKNATAKQVYKQKVIQMDKALADTNCKIGTMMYNQLTMNPMYSQGGGLLGTGSTTIKAITLDLGELTNNDLFQGLLDGNDLQEVDFDLALKDVLAMMGTLEPDETEKMNLDEQIKQSTNHVEEAILIYEQYLTRSTNKNDDNIPSALLSLNERKQWQMALALAYQTAASIASIDNHFFQTRKYLNRALDVYLYDILLLSSSRQQNQNDVDKDHDDDTIMIKKYIADIYVALANTNLQLGDYDETKRIYEKSMEWHNNENIDVFTIFSLYGDNVDDDTTGINTVMQLYREQLEQYRKYAKGGKDSDGTTATADDIFAMYLRKEDDGYEGEILSAMGSLYLSKGETERGLQLLNQAVELLSRTVDSKQTYRRSLAETKLNLARALFYSRRFEESQIVHFAALDMYKELYGDGVNPLTQVMEEIQDLYKESLGEQFTDQVSALFGGKDTSDDGPKLNIDIEQFRASRANTSVLGVDEDNLDKSGREEL